MVGYQGMGEGGNEFLKRNSVIIYKNNGNKGGYDKN